MKVLIADKRELFREGLVLLLKQEPNVKSVMTCSTGSEAVTKAVECNPDIILMDTEISECDCIEAIQRVSEKLPEVKIIVLTHSEESDDLISCLKAGARAYVTKDVSMNGLTSTIFRIYEGEVIITAPVAGKMLDEFKRLEESKELPEKKRKFSLSEREREVLRIVARGASNREIADSLFLTLNTVKSHLRRIMEKLHVHSRYQLAVLAHEEQIESNNSNKED